MIEYGLLIFLASVIVIAILIILGPQTGSIFSTVSNTI
ncbi:MAG: pilus assembly protein [Chloroflexi bacterium]|nr:pilus assembly protein [Chloroflexota bacterium]